jgi:hypothetical protein
MEPKKEGQKETKERKLTEKDTNKTKPHEET